MKKQIIFIIFLAISFVTTNNIRAQQGEFKINAAAEVGIPLGDFSDITSFGFGVTGKGLYGVSDDGQVGLTIGYLSFSGKKYQGYKYGNYGVIPIMGSYRHFFDAFYGEAQLGFANIGVRYAGISHTSTDFSWAIGGGYTFDQFDASLRYQGVQTSGDSVGWIGLRFGYTFDL